MTERAHTQTDRHSTTGQAKPPPLLRLAGVCGWPIYHSLSPIIHNHWIKALGLRGHYVHFAVRPDEAVRAFKSLKKTSISGVNVTLPLKSYAYAAADIWSPEAKKLGVANCLYKSDAGLVAHNTDMEGFLVPLIAQIGIHNLTGVSAIIYGAGGAARAVIGALLSIGVPEIRLCARNEEAVENIINEINVPNLYGLSWRDRHTALSHAGLIVNASAGGMAGKDALDIDLSYVRSAGSFVYDLVYTPLKTPLLIQAEKIGLRSLGGLDMLIAQARPSFKLFYGEAPPKDTGLYSLLVKTLEQNP